MNSDQPLYQSIQTQSFAQVFHLHPADALQYSNRMKKQFEDFVNAFKQRIEVEIQYSKGLYKVSKMLDKHIKPGSDLITSYISSAFKIEHEQKARQCLQMVETIHTEIQVISETMLRAQAAALKKYQKEVKNYYSQIQDREQAYQKILKKYNRCREQHDQLKIQKNIMLHTVGISQDKKTKMNLRCLDSTREMKQLQKNYLNSISQYNQFAARYNKQIKQMMKDTEKKIRQALIIEADSLRKLIVCEISMFKNIEYDLINISKQMESMNPVKDVQKFVIEEGKKYNNLIFKEIGNNADNQKSLQQGEILQKIKKRQSMLTISLNNIEESFTWMEKHKKNPTFIALMDSIWKFYNKNKTIQKELTSTQNENQKQSQSIKSSNIISQEIYKDLNDFIKNLSSSYLLVNSKILNQAKEDKNSEDLSKDCLVLIQCISNIWNKQLQENEAVQNLAIIRKNFEDSDFFRYIGVMYLQQYQNQRQVKIKGRIQAQNLAQLFIILFEEGGKNSDIFNLRSLLFLMFTLYYQQNEEKNIKFLYYNHRLYELQIWGVYDFWQGCIFETTFEQLKYLTKYESKQGREQLQIRQKNSIFSLLISYCYYMIMLGMKNISVRQIVGNYCKFYEMSEEQNRDLLKTINNSMKQYKKFISFMYQQ